MSDQRNNPAREPCDGRTAWDRALIERFCDGDLPPDQARQLTEDAASSPVLGKEVASVRELDSLIARTLLSVPQRAEPAPALRLFAGAAVAAAAILLAVAWWNWPPKRTIDRAPAVIAAQTEHTRAVADAETSPPPVRGVRVVFSIPLRDPEGASQAPVPVQAVASATDGEPTTGTPANDDAVVAASTPDESEIMAARARWNAEFDRALSRGDVAAVASVIVQADQTARAHVLARLSPVASSALSAQKLLDALPGDIAVDVCRAWLRDGLQRPVALKHLRGRALDGSLRDRVHVAVHQLVEENPELRPWVVSYTNWALSTEPPSKAKDGAGVEKKTMPTDAANA
ncbi:MAG: hypothetical protein GIKADHBN_02097 [Phycisphaerales bacterium]|nr:hypothetical protein [Phycisphaerales bacterium]